MRLPNGYNIMCRCGRPDCIEKTGELGPGCVQEYGLWLPNRYLSQAKSYVPADRARKLAQAPRERDRTRARKDRPRRRRD